MRGPIPLLCLFALIGLAWTAPARAQEVFERDADLADRPITSIRVEGVKADEEQLVRNNLRTAVGDGYDAQTVRDDVNRLFRLGRFLFVTAEAQLAQDGTVQVLFTLTPQPPIEAVEIVGNKAIPDEDLRALVRQVPGGPRDRYLIEKAKRDIKAEYRKKGYYHTEVSIDESELAERGLLIFDVIEGPRVKVEAIEFDGATAFPTKQLMGEIKTRTHVFLLRAGVLDENLLSRDEASLDAFYKDRGYLDVRTGHTIQLSPDNTEAKVVFLISEGRQYTLGSVRAERFDRPGEPLEVFTPEQLAALLEIKTGDVYSRDKLRGSIEIVEDGYGEQGYLDVRVDPSELRKGPEPVVDLLLVVDEGKQANVGLVQINGNFLTKDKVIRRLIKVKPGRPYNTVKLRESEKKITATRLFNNVRLTLQEEDPENPGYRDLLVEVKEKNTGSVNFGVAVGSDSGLFGEFSLTQNNFDIADVPASFGEFVTGRAFRGAGQQFSMVFRPGNEIFQYSISLTEPHLLETDYALSTVGAWAKRVYDNYDEERFTASVGLSRQFGEIWSASARLRAERVELTDIDPSAPTEIFEDAGPDNLGVVGVSIARTTIDQFTRPGSGSRFTLSFDSIGAVWGSVNFLRVSGDYTVYLTLDEDFLGRKTTLKLTSRVGYIFNGRAPTYERFYLGGRSFRGFDFRTVSPKGIRADNGQPSNDPVGGNWLFFSGAQYEMPLFQESITGVLFLDSGTVTDSVGFSDYRVSVGAGVRLYIPQLGPVPIAFDFGFPLRKLSSDDTQVLSFSAELPF